DVVARLGGDEFAVLLALPPAAGPEAAEAAGHRVRAVLGTPDPELDGSLHSTASVGVAVSERGAADATTLLREADLAMYRGKSAGGDRVVVVRDVGGQLHCPLPGGELGAALAGDALTLHYQPIVEVATRAVASVEALVRWVHPRQGLLGPARILPEAERHGMLRRLDAWVLHRACADLARWTEQLGAQAPAYVNVNVSSALLAHPDLVATVLAATEAANLDPARLRLEIPEAADLDAVLAAAPQLRELRSQGVSLTLDDMGAGSSSLRHLSQLAVDGLKIDRSFVAGLLGNDRDLAVVRLLVDLGAGLGLLVTAEGVEEADQLARLADLGCPYAQGYHLGRPVPTEQLPAVLAAWAG
ncbi:MAG: putative bifunctional diguanylate cyclase/phosphodiesterase, partial [Actinomycetota bacterium]